MFKQIIFFVGWRYLPDWLTRLCLGVFYLFYRRVLRRTPPAPQTPLRALHYRVVYVLAIASYLAYNVYQTTVSTPLNYYEILGAHPTADLASLKTAFRHFAKRNHPDRVGPQGETAFIEVRNAFEALKDPVTRFAYDRFGPDVLRWPHCSTEREFVHFGMMQAVGFHIVAFVSLILWSVLGGSHPAQLWRYFIYLLILAFELIFILGPSQTAHTTVHVSPLLFYESLSPPYTRFFATLWPRRVAWQHVRFLHNLFLFSTAAVTRLAPALMPQVLDAKQLCAEIDHLNALARAIDHEIGLQIRTELHSIHGPQTGTAATDATFTYTPPCKPADEIVAMLSSEMENMCIEAMLRRDAGPLRSAVDVAVSKRRKTEKEANYGVPSPDPSPPPPNAITDFRTWKPPKDDPTPSKHALRMTAISDEFYRGRSRSC
ncbi:DnaJ-domain-containing protein [Obba rivulosa]|uniref:DnaJ-domain-containing protein n=1 Tax=Obba rivulosa TaxID=1052685 RepID=A0A8E2ANN8_9APHY|nr:DnaJ-domain-containing protein [Obba rivulosa]